MMVTCKHLNTPQELEGQNKSHMNKSAQGPKGTIFPLQT